ncbi:hypothetical protein P4C99_22085, partial [Pontiellaceae bacterium B1224]|nr:hypothetical protein [Pontiellaceae bacterium B1224]
DRIAVNNNVGNGGSWAASINTTLDGSGDVTLTDVTIGFRTYNASGGYNGSDRAINWGVEIINTTSSTSLGSISADSAVVSASPQPTDGSLDLTFSAPITLSGTDAFEFRVTAAEVSTGSLGVHTGINDITFYGTVFSAESPTITASVSGGSFILEWDGGAHNVETNADLLSSEWAVSVSNAVPPVTNVIGGDGGLFYRLAR